MSNLSKNGKFREFASQLIKFCGVGVINTAVDFGIFTAVIRLGMLCFNPGESYKYFAQTLSYLSGVFVSYILNKRFTFGAKKNYSKLSVVKMYVLNGCTFLISMVLLGFFSRFIRIPELAKLFATIPVMLINFIGSKFWVFAEKKD